jgi:hypothetical protein
MYAFSNTWVWRRCFDCFHVRWFGMKFCFFLFFFLQTLGKLRTGSIFSLLCVARIVVSMLFVIVVVFFNVIHIVVVPLSFVSVGLFVTPTATQHLLRMDYVVSRLSFLISQDPMTWKSGKAFFLLIVFPSPPLWSSVKERWLSTRRCWLRIPLRLAILGLE